MSTAIVENMRVLGEKSHILFSGQNLSITEEECLKVEIARCDRQIEYYQKLKKQLETELDILNGK